MQQGIENEQLVTPDKKKKKIGNKKSHRQTLLQYLFMKQGKNVEPF